MLKDAQDVHQLLCSAAHGGYLLANTRLLLDEQATADGIRRGLRWLADKACIGDTAIVFFSGHGGRVATESEPANYLLPYDTESGNLNGTAISGSELTALLRKIQAQRLLVLFDCCYAGGTGETKGLEDAIDFKSGLAEQYYARLATGIGRVIIASSRSDEQSLLFRSMANSLFTHYLLEALRGHARTRGDGLIRVLDVFDYVSQKVPQHASQKSASQHPILKVSDLENNFPIALYLGGKSKGSQSPALSQPIAINKRTLRNALLKTFDLTDLRLLCDDITEDLANDGIDLAVNLNILGGDNHRDRVLNLIRYLDNRGYLAYLAAAVRRERPNVVL